MAVNNLNLTFNSMMQALGWPYDKAINGLPGQKGVVNLGKMVPVVGAIIGGSIDIVITKTVAKRTKETLQQMVFLDNGRVIIDN